MMNQTKTFNPNQPESTNALSPLEPNVTSGLLRGYNPTLANSVARTERPQSSTEGLGRKLVKRAGVLAVATVAALGIVHVANAGDSTPALDTPYTATGNETPNGVAHDVMGNNEWRNLNDELVEDSGRNGQPGYQPGEQVNMPHQYVEHQQAEHNQ